MQPLIDLLFPKICLICKREGDYLCPDCKSVLDILTVHRKYSNQNLDDLYFALVCQSPFVKSLIKKFKQEPFVKELAKTFSDLIIEHLQLIDNQPDFKHFIIVPVPIEKKKLKRQGFSQAEELAKELSNYFKLPLLNCLFKEKDFQIKDRKEVENKKIILVDDIYLNNSDIEICAKLLKQHGTEEVVGMAIARG